MVEKNEIDACTVVIPGERIESVEKIGLNMVMKLRLASVNFET